MRPNLKVNVPFKTQQFVVLTAQAGNFHKAARILGIDPSVIVRSVDRLEGELGTRVFSRSRHHFAVTEAGRLFVSEIQQAITHVERACDLAQYHSQIEEGPIRLGYSAYVHTRLIPILERLDLSVATQAGEDLIATDDMRAHSMRSKVVLQSGVTMQLIERVQRGDLHAAFGVQPLPLEEDLSTETVTREGFCLGVSKNHPLARRATVLARDMDGEVVFLLPRDSHPGLYDGIVEYIESTGAKAILREVISFTHAMEIVAHNFGVALLPRSASRLTYMGVLFRPVTDKLLRIETALFLRRDSRSDRLQWFRRELLSRIRNASLEPY